MTPLILTDRALLFRRFSLITRACAHSLSRRSSHLCGPRDLRRHASTSVAERLALSQKSHRPAQRYGPARQAKVALERNNAKRSQTAGRAKLAGQDPQTGSSRPGLASRYYLHPTQESWLYLSGILYHCSRRCIGWHAQESLASSLVSLAWKSLLNQPLARGLLPLSVAAFSRHHPFKRSCTLVARPLP